MKPLILIFALGVAGALGTVSRYGVSQLTLWWFGSRYPWGTFCVNILGCLLFGIFAELFTSGRFSPEWKLVVLTGFLGGFTTFSAFAFEMEQLRGLGFPHLALLHFAGNNILGIFAMIAGMMIGRSVT
ncbi:MAG: CrcB family protein [Planctomycetaceae bacterium]|jgi:CrcB protein|nr:CrcB family protein [Planctomycetaceae bacterium]